MIQISIPFHVNITSDDVDYIMECAKTGCSHWCEMKLKEEPLGQDIAEQISRHGSLRLFDNQNHFVYTLTLLKLTAGIERYLKKPVAGDFLEQVDHEFRINTDYIDEEVADAIIQYAVMGGIHYEK